jgi:hypothetical protein
MNSDMSKYLKSALFGIFRIMAYFSQAVKTLIIHPKDPATDVLTGIYSGLNNKTVIIGGIPKLDLRKLIKTHDRIFMLGHGSPWGLLSMGQFPYTNGYIIDDSIVVELKEKTRNLYIWCHADQLVRRHKLSGLNCGMFISEVGEASIYGFEDVDLATIDRSNEIYVHIVSKYINEPMEVLYEKLIYEYGLLARTNPIAKFNIQRLFLIGSAINKNKVVANLK